MLLKAKSFSKGVILGVTLLSPVVGFADRTFTYSANDYKVVVATEPGPISIPVRTLVIIQPSGDLKTEVVGPTRTFTLKLQPPEAKDPRFVSAFIENRLLDIRITSTNVDGEYEATVELPLHFGLNPTIKVDWGTQNLGILETTVETTLKETPTLHALAIHQKRSAKR